MSKPLVVVFLMSVFFVGAGYLVLYVILRVMRKSNKRLMRLSLIFLIMLFSLLFYYTFGFRDIFSVPIQNWGTSYGEYTKSLIYEVNDRFIPILLTFGVVSVLIMRYAGRNSIPVEATYDFLYVTFLGVTLASSAHILGINALLLKILWVFFGVLVLAIRWTILGQVIESIADFVTIIWRSIEGVGAILVAIVKLFVAILITLFRIVENIIRSLIEWFIEHPIDWLRKAGYAVIYNIHSVVERLDNATYKLLSIIYEDSDLAGRRIRTNLLLRSRIVNPELDSISETLWSKIRGNVICSYESHNWHAPSDFLRICFHCGEVVCTLHSRSLIISKDMLNNKGGAVSQWYKEFSTYGDDFIIQQFGRLIKRPSTVVSKNVETTVFFCKSHSRDDLATYKAFFPLSGREELLRITQRLHEQSKFLKELLSELWSRMEKLISLIRDWMESIKRPKKSSNHE